MKFWLFDGNDVTGPFSPQELAARADFSATSLICAENASEDSAGWQMAQMFEAFRFNAATGKVEGVFPVDTNTLYTTGKLPPVTDTPAPAAEPVSASAQDTWVPPAKAPEPAPAELPKTKTAGKKKKTNAQEKAAAAMKAARSIAVVRLSKHKQLTEPPAPVALARENVELVLPGKQDTPDGAKSKPQTPAPAEKETQTPAPQAEVLSTCTLPIVNEVLDKSDLPPLPEKSFQTVALPDTPAFDLKEFQPHEAQETPVPEVSPETTDSQEQNQPASQPQPAPQAEVEELVPAKETQDSSAAAPAQDAGQEDSVQEEAAKLLETFSHHSLPKAKPSEYPMPKRPRQRTVSQIEKEFAPPPEQEEFLLEQQLLATPTRKKARVMLGMLLLIVFLLSGGAFWASRSAARAKAAKAEPSIAAAMATAPELLQEKKTKPQQPLATPPAQAPAAKPAAVPKPDTAADKALALVQNFHLSNNRGTVASYFDRLYQPNMEQGYTASWSVEPLHKNTYIVKYRLTKTRMEPIVYVFQADVKKGKLTGALNNIALDLVGRI